MFAKRIVKGAEPLNTCTVEEVRGVIILLVEGIIIIVGVLLSVGYLTLAERKVLGSIQCRKGPNIVGLYGLLQPIADGIKLLVKEIIIPQQTSKGLYIGSAVLSLTIAIGAWGVIPLGKGVVQGDIAMGVLYILAISSMGVYSIMIGGWASNNRYSYIGGIRAVAQMISYELAIGIIVIVVVISIGSYSLTEIVEGQRIWYIVGIMPLGVMYYISILAETGRVPFDLTEAESELVSGYNVEYGGMGFGLLFIAEYANIIVMGTIGVILFIGG